MMMTTSPIGDTANEQTKFQNTLSSMEGKMITLYFTKQFTGGVLKGLFYNESMRFVSDAAAAEFLKVMRKGSKKVDWKIVDASYQKYWRY